MSAPVRIYLSFDTADAGTTEGLQKHLRAAFAGLPLELRDRSSLYPGTDNALGGEAWLRWADLCIAVFSSDYLGQDTSREWEIAKRLERERRPGLQILVAYARSAAFPPDFQAFPVAPSATEPVQQPGFDRDRQLARIAHMARTLLNTRSAMATPPSPEALAGKNVEMTNDALPLDFAQTLLQAASTRLNLLPQLALLKKIADDASLKKAAYEMEDLFGETLRQGKLAKIPLAEYLQRNDTVCADFQFVVKNLTEKDLAPGWRAAFLSTYASHLAPNSPLALFTPTDDISIPETLNLPVTSGDTADNFGALSYQQKSDFRRELLLAQDALSVENYARAHSHCERVRTQIDAQSAQLYEYLLLSFVQHETPARIALDAVDDEKRRLLNHVVLYANRLREYQETRLCSSQTGEYNLRATAEELSNALCRLYDQLPNDYLLDTGKRAAEMPDNRAIVARCREVGEIVFRSIHPYTGFLETLVLELCGGGKYHWIKRVEVTGDEFVFVSLQNFEIETSAAELVSLLSTATRDRAGVEYRMSQELFIQLRAKRKRLHRYLAEEKRRYRKFNDPRESVVQFVQACLLGYNLFGATPPPTGGETRHTPTLGGSNGASLVPPPVGGGAGGGVSFLRLALEYLVPSLVIQPDPDAAESIRWFDLDQQGNVVAHPDCARYQFDAFAVVEKIVRDCGGRAGWLHVSPNLHREVYLQFVADTQAEYERVRDGLQWTDFRRIPDLEARRVLVDCMRRWVVAYRAFPDEGQQFLDRCVDEITGSGLLNWLYLNPNELVTHPDSLAFGFDARAELRAVCDLSLRHTEPELGRRVVENLFQQKIRPAYDALRRGDEAGRSTVVELLLQAFAAYRLSPDPRYLDFVFAELTEEVKFRWVNIGEDGKAKPWTFQSDRPFAPLDVLEGLATTDPKRYARYTVRGRIAERRHADQLERYFQEISEFRQENRRPERAITIDILRKMSGIFRYFPKEEFLQLSVSELTGKGRIRWNALFLGFFPTRENHFENKFYHFNYRFELFELKRLLDNHYTEMERVMRECGELPT